MAIVALSGDGSQGTTEAGGEDAPQTSQVLSSALPFPPPEDIDDTQQINFCVTNHSQAVGAL